VIGRASLGTLLKRAGDCCAAAFARPAARPEPEETEETQEAVEPKLLPPVSVSSDLRHRPRAGGVHLSKDAIT